MTTLPRYYVDFSFLPNRTSGVQYAIAASDAATATQIALERVQREHPDYPVEHAGTFLAPDPGSPEAERIAAAVAPAPDPIISVEPDTILDGDRDETPNA